MVIRCIVSGQGSVLPRTSALLLRVLSPGLRKPGSDILRSYTIHKHLKTSLPKDATSFGDKAGCMQIRSVEQLLPPSMELFCQQ